MEREPPGRRRRPAWALLSVEVLAWALVAWGAWLLSLSAIGQPDLLVGGLCALAAGAAAARARRAIGGRWRPSVDLVRPLAVLPLAIVVDSVAVLGSPWRPRRRRASVTRADLGAGGDGPVAAARRAIATVAISASPSSVVLDVERRTGVMVLHTLGSRGPSVLDRYRKERTGRHRAGAHAQGCG